MADKPSNNLDWCADNDPTKVIQPTSELAAQGFTASEPATFQNINYMFRNLDQWVQWLAGQSAISQAVASLFTNVRLEDGGYWNFYLSNGQLNWTDTFSISVPGLDDAYNQCQSASVTLNDGDVAYVNVNVPFSVNGDIQASSNVIQNISQISGISAGQSVLGANIPSGTTVVSVAADSVELSAAATSTQNAEALTFVNVAPLTAVAVHKTNFQPQSNSLVFALRDGESVYLGVNAITSVIRNAEWKVLGGDGYTHFMFGTFGQDVVRGQAVYISDGTDGNAAGTFYLSDASIGRGAVAGRFAGFVLEDSIASGATGNIVSAGCASGFFQNLTVGANYYVDPANPGAITPTKPVVSGQYVVPVGVAQDASDLFLAPIGSGQPATSSSPWPQYGVNNESEFIAAINACNSAGGGVIVLLSSFDVSTAFVGDYTTVIGRGWATTLRVNGNGNGGLGVGSHCTLQNVGFQNSDSTDGTLCVLWGSDNDVQNCLFSVPHASNRLCLAMQGNQNASVRNRFFGVAESDTAYALSFSGVECADRDSVFLSSPIPFAN